MISLFKNKYLKHKETANNFFWRVLQIFGKQGITFFIFIVCAKFLNPTDFGVYNYVLALIFLLVIFGDFGISTATSKYVAENSINDKEKIKGVLFNSGLIILGLTVVVAIVALIFGPKYLGDKYLYALYLLPLVFFAPATSLYDGVYRGLKKFKQLAVISTIVGVLSIALFYYLVVNFGLFGALIAQDIFYFILFLALALGHRDVNFKLNKAIIASIAGYAILIGLADAGQFLYTRVDIIMLGHFNFVEEIGYYEIVNKIFQMAVLPVMILATVIAPNSTKNFILKRYDYIKNKIIKEVIFLFFSGLIFSVVLYFLFPIIFTWFLPAYDGKLLSKMLIIILTILPFRFFSTFLGIGYITPMGFVKITTITLMIFGIINVILDYILISIFGFMGVLYATLLVQFGYIFFNTLLFVLKFKKAINS